MRKPRPTLSDIPPSARIDPQTEEHLRTFWGEVGNDAMYAIGKPEPQGQYRLTPIDLFVRRSTIEQREYLSSMNLSVAFAEMADIREGRYVSCPPSRNAASEPPEVAAALAAAREADKRYPSPSPDSSRQQGRELRFRFARLENIGTNQDMHGFFHKRLWVWGEIPAASTLCIRDELRLVISCLQLQDLDRLFLRPAPPQIAVH